MKVELHLQKTARTWVAAAPMRLLDNGAMIPLWRFGRPEHMAKTAVFLASDCPASNVAGATGAAVLPVQEDVELVSWIF